MILYISIILIAMTLISVANIIFTSINMWYIISMVTITTIFQFAIDGLFAFIVNKLPNKWFGMNKKCFNVSNKTQRFYEKLGIRKWKDRVWELGGLSGFSKSKLNQPTNPEYIEQFIIESNKGIVTHRLGYVLGFLGIFIFPLKYALGIGIPVALVNLVLNILPTMILRYNVPKLKILHKRLTRNQMLKEQQKDIA